MMIRAYIFIAVVGFLITAIILPRIAAILFFLACAWTIGMVTETFNQKDLDDDDR